MSIIFLGLLLNSYLFWCSHGENKLGSLYGEDLDRGVDQHHKLFAYKGSIPLLSARKDIVRLDRMNAGFIHEVVFVVHQRNMDELTRMLHDVSDPRSINYGRHMTHEEVTSFTENSEARDYIVNYLIGNGATVTSETLGSEYITANAPITVWEKILNTQFYAFHQTQSDGTIEKLVRAERYWIPLDLDLHVDSIFNTIQIPYRVLGNLPVLDLLPEIDAKKFSTTESLNGYTTPAKIKAYYNVTTNKGSHLSTQGVFATIGQYFSPADLSAFQVSLGLPNQPAAGSIGGYSSDAKCIANPNSCAEGNLDIQYMMAVSPGSPTTYWYSNLMFSHWLVTVAASNNPPLVFSISYGADEAAMSKSEMEAFSTQAIKLGMMGVTLVAASGDDGAVSDNVRGLGVSACEYSPLFPGSNPYVVSVGATAGIESGLKETVAQSDNGQSFTSGGGFSTFYSQPSWQTAAIEGYIAEAAAVNRTAVHGFYFNNRGYPDLTFAGFNYAVVIGGTFYKVSGTSASTPALGGLLSNINAARMATGKGSIGFINPTLYANYTSFVNDITSGNNRCSANAVCCAQGFFATKGWDPASGLGSIDYGKMQALFLSLGEIGEKVVPGTDPTNNPTLRPSSAPTKAIYSIIQIRQTFAGLSADQASSPAFTAALTSTISASTRLATISSVDVLSLQKVSQIGVNVTYTFTATSGISSNQLISRLASSVFSGLFLTSLKSNSGIAITRQSGFIAQNLSPTFDPSATPSNAPSEAPVGAVQVIEKRPALSVTVIAVLGSVCGAILVICLIGIACCFRLYCDGIRERREGVSHLPSATDSGPASPPNILEGLVLPPPFMSCPSSPTHARCDTGRLVPTSSYY